MPSSIFTVSLGFTNTTPTQMVGKARTHVTMMTGNAAFATPHPTLLIITAACDALEVANNAYEFNRGKVEKQTRDTRFKELKQLLRELGGYVQSNCNGDKNLILSTGFDVRKANQPLGQLSAPVNVLALVTLYPGKLEVRWDGVKGRSTYELWMTADDPNVESSWKLHTLTTKTRFMVESLTSNKVYTFRVVAQGPLGASPVSDVASAKAA
jgi:hypothetical protein